MEQNSATVGRIVNIFATQKATIAVFCAVLPSFTKTAFRSHELDLLQEDKDVIETYIIEKLAKITWPLWFYVAITGPIVYWFIAPYYA